MKNPKLKIKYATGLGDFTACILHSKLLNGIVYFFTKSNEPCKTCSQRIQALNILFPIPFWRLFFKKMEDFDLSLRNEFGSYSNYISLNKHSTHIPKTISPIPPKIDNNISGYDMINSTDNNLGEYLVRVQTFKLK
jgi:hypothetical protein